LSDFDPTLAEIFWGATGALLLIAVAAGVAEWRRGKRKRLDQVGWVPWNLIQILAFFAAFAAAALALKA